MQKNGAGNVSKHHADELSVDMFRSICNAALDAGMANGR